MQGAAILAIVVRIAEDQGAFQMKFLTRKLEIPNSQFRWNASLIYPG